MLGLSQDNLYKAIEDNDIKALTKALSNGADVDARNTAGQTPLGLAIEKGNIEAVETLLKNAANVDKISNGSIPFILATQHGNMAILAILLNYGANIDVQDEKKQTSLMHASLMNAPNIVKFLLENHANRFLRDETGKMPINIARERGFTEVLKCLQTHNALFIKPSSTPAAVHSKSIIKSSYTPSGAHSLASVFSASGKTPTPKTENDFATWLKTEYDMDWFDAGGAGNCQFYAIAKQLIQHHPALVTSLLEDPLALSASNEKFTRESLAKYLRKAAVGYIASHPKEFEKDICPHIPKPEAGEKPGVILAHDVHYENIADYVKKMRTDGHYGDQHTIRALQRRLSLDFIVLHPNMKKDQMYLANCLYLTDHHKIQDNPIIIIHTGGLHYVTISNKADKKFFVEVANLIETGLHYES